MEVQGWLEVCDIRGIPAHQLSCGQAAPTVWVEKYCGLSDGKLWMIDVDSNQLCDEEGNDSSKILREAEDHFFTPRNGELIDIESNDGRRRRPVESLIDSDADVLINKSFLQKKITPNIRRRPARPMLTGKENRPSYVDLTSLVSQAEGGRKPESEVGTTFFMPTIETPDMLNLSGEDDAIVRPLHHSILGKDYCFEVITVSGSRCFCCKSAGEREAWIEKIKRTLNPNLDNVRRTENQLSLWVQEAKGIQVKKKYFCEICLDRQLYARTTSKLKDDSSTFWGENFEFTSIPDIENITVHLYKDSDKKKKKDKDYVGLVNISVQMLTNRQTIEKWYTLSTPSGNNKNKSGEMMAIRIKARFQSVCVLPMEQYKDFAEHISKEYMLMCKTMKGALSVSKKDELSRSLVFIMHATGTIKEFMTEIVMNEVANVEEESLIFRENTIATKAVEHFLRLVGMGYLHEALGDFVATLFESHEDCEVDGSRLPANAVLEQNQKNLQMCCEIAMCKIMNSIKIFPHELREVFSMWRSRCESCNRPRIASRLITASLFLRLLCPAILNPSLFGLANELPRPNAARTLTLVAKVIQNLANRSRFGDKEEYMKFMNVFVREQWDQMGGFLNDVTDANKTSASNGFEGFIDLGRELAKLHAFFTENIQEMDQNVISDLGELPSILASITEHVNQPQPASQIGSKINRIVSRSMSQSQVTSLDKITEDVQVSNASDHILLPVETTSTPVTGRRGLAQDSSSLLDMVSEGFPALTTASNFSDNGSQISVPGNGSFNNSNNSHRPSLVSMENVAEFACQNATTQLHQSQRWNGGLSKPPLSFSNPAYLQRHPAELLRGVSSPAALHPAIGLSCGNVESANSLKRYAETNTSSTTVSSTKPQQTLSSSSRHQPLSFINPLQMLQTPTDVSSKSNRKHVASIRSNSQIETVFTSETVTYTTQASNVTTSSAKDGKVENIVKDTLVEIHEICSEVESANESYHSNDTLSSRPSSTTTENTDSNSNIVQQTEKLQLPVSKHRSHTNVGSRSAKPSSSNNTQVSRSGNGEGKPLPVATSTSIPVANARHCTGLQKQQIHSLSKPSTHTNAPQQGSRRVSASSEVLKAPCHIARTSNPLAAKNVRKPSNNKMGHQASVDHKQNVVIQTLKSVREDESDQLVTGKPVSAVAINAANATRVRMTRKTRSGAVPPVTQPVVKNNMACEKYHVGRRNSHQRNLGQVSHHQAAESGFLPASTESPLSPEERTAQWILSNVPPVAKEPVLQSVDSPNTSFNQSKASRSSNKEHDDATVRLKGDIEVLRTRLSETENSNRLLKQREETLMDQVKSSDRREAHLQERLRMVEEKMQRQVQENDDTKRDFLLRMSKAEDEQKRDREELQGVIDEKDIIVSTQRKRIASLEETNARLLRVVYERERSESSSNLQSTYNHNPALPYHKDNTRHARKSQKRSEQNLEKHTVNKTSPSASMVNGEYRIEGLSSAGSSSSSV